MKNLNLINKRGLKDLYDSLSLSRLSRSVCKSLSPFPLFASPCNCKSGLLGDTEARFVVQFWQRINCIWLFCMFILGREKDTYAWSFLRPYISFWRFVEMTADMCFFSLRLCLCLSICLSLPFFLVTNPLSLCLSTHSPPPTPNSEGKIFLYPLLSFLPSLPPTPPSLPPSVIDRHTV